MSENNWLSAVRFGPDGLVPVVAQERRSGDVLMVAYADREALERTLSTGLAHYFSRSRNALWRKGQTSGHEQRVVDIRLDCDGDTVLYRVEQSGPACHTGARTCLRRSETRPSSRPSTTAAVMYGFSRFRAGPPPTSGARRNSTSESANAECAPKVRLEKTSPRL